MIKKFLQTMVGSLMFLTCSQITEVARIIILNIINCSAFLRQYSKTIIALVIPILGILTIFMIYAILDSLPPEKQE